MRNCEILTLTKGLARLERSCRVQPPVEPASVASVVWWDLADLNPCHVLGACAQLLEQVLVQATLQRKAAEEDVCRPLLRCNLRHQTLPCPQAMGLVANEPLSYEGKRKANPLVVDGEEDAHSPVDMLHDTGVALLALLGEDFARDQHALPLQLVLLIALVLDRPAHIPLVKVGWKMNQDRRTCVQLNQCAPLESFVHGAVTPARPRRKHLDDVAYTWSLVWRHGHIIIGRTRFRLFRATMWCSLGPSVPLAPLAWMPDQDLFRATLVLLRDATVVQTT